MDAFSLVIGSLLGGLVGWAFAAASAKQHDASTKLNKASQALEEKSKKEVEAKDNKESSFSDVLQSFLLRLLGFATIVVLGMIVINSIG